MEAVNGTTRWEMMLELVPQYAWLERPSADTGVTPVLQYPQYAVRDALSHALAMAVGDDTTEGQ